MKLRLTGAAVLAGALAVSVTAHAATPTLDGKKVKRLTATFSPTAQDHDQDFVGLSGPERVECTAPRCGRLPFTYAPARGTSGPVGFALSWSIPVEDLDLYVASINRNGIPVEIAACGGSAGTNEKLVVSGLKPGRYALIADYYRSTGGKATGTVTYPAGFAVKSTAPAAVEDNALHVNCAIS